MADILRPELQWIEGRCYRITDPNSKITPLQEYDLYENETMFEDSRDEDDDFEVTMVNDSRYCSEFHISKHYMGSIIGKKGATRVRIERDTKTDIKIQGQSGNIVIFGSAASNVKAARRRINVILMSSRMKQRPTHFLSIPLNQADLIKSFDTFKELVLKECPNPTLEESLFISPQKLHLTVGVMCLMDSEERLIAMDLFKEAKDKIVIPMLKDHMPFKIRLKGLSYMNDDPKQIHVLYANVTADDWVTAELLQRLADSLFEHFYKAGYMKRDHDRDNVKLHLTVLNSKYRNNMNISDVSTKRVPFDGSQILEKFGDYDFGCAELKEIHLSQHHSTGPDGFYQSTDVLTLESLF